MNFFQVNSKCNGCLACLHNCPANAIEVQDNGNKRHLRHNMARCARCGNCWRVCPQDAVEFQYMLQNRWDEVVTLELEHCHICGEPIYTTAFGKTLTEKLGNAESPVCERHRPAFARKVKTHFIGHK